MRASEWAAAGEAIRDALRREPSKPKPAQAEYGGWFQVRYDGNYCWWCVRKIEPGQWARFYEDEIVCRECGGDEIR